MLAVKSPVATPFDPYLIPGTAKARVLSQAPYFPRCSNDKTACLSRPTQQALDFPYMQINPKGMVSWLIFDLDHTNSFIWEATNLPPPNLIVQDPKTCRSHLFYAIEPVCTTQKAREKPILYMKAIYAAFATKLHADLNYHSGPVAKTPGHRAWRTTELHAKIYSLSELHEYVELEPIKPWWNTPPKSTLDSNSRHCILFDFVRYKAYASVLEEKKTGSLESFYIKLLNFAETKNSFEKYGFSQDLSFSSLKATVKSVARWTWEKYKGRGSVMRGLMELDPALPLKERQRLSATRTHEVRRNKTLQKIHDASKALKDQQITLTKEVIALKANLSRQTVAKYQIDSELNQGETLIAAQLQTNVKFGVYQVSTGLRGLSSKEEISIEDVPGLDTEQINRSNVLAFRKKYRILDG